MEYEGVKDVNDGFAPGKKQFNFELTDAGRSAGFTAASVGRALRDSYFGAEVLRQARGREEMRVYVRLPPEERESSTPSMTYSRNPGRGEMPLQEAATIIPGRSAVEIRR